MKIKAINKVDPLIKEHVANLNDRYFRQLNVGVGLFQSGKENVSLDFQSKSKSAPAVLVSKEEFPLLKELFLELKELNGLFDYDIEYIVWLGTDTFDKGKYKADRVVAHELRHIEQRSADLKTIYKDRLLDIVIFKYVSPIEVDADNFANMTVARSYNKKYDWVREVKILFDKNNAKIKAINKAIFRNNKEIIVDGEAFLELSTNQDLKNLFRYYFQMLKRF